MKALIILIFFKNSLINVNFFVLMSLIKEAHDFIIFYELVVLALMIVLIFERCEDIFNSIYKFTYFCYLLLLMLLNFKDYLSIQNISNFSDFFKCLQIYNKELLILFKIEDSKEFSSIFEFLHYRIQHNPNIVFSIPKCVSNRDSTVYLILQFLLSMSLCFFAISLVSNSLEIFYMIDPNQIAGAASSSDKIAYNVYQVAVYHGHHYISCDNLEAALHHAYLNDWNAISQDINSSRLNPKSHPQIYFFAPSLNYAHKLFELSRVQTALERGVIDINSALCLAEQVRTNININDQLSYAYAVKTIDNLEAVRALKAPIFANPSSGKGAALNILQLVAENTDVSINAKVYLSSKKAFYNDFLDNYQKPIDYLDFHATKRLKPIEASAEMVVGDIFRDTSRRLHDNLTLLPRMHDRVVLNVMPVLDNSILVSRKHGHAMSLNSAIIPGIHETVSDMMRCDIDSIILRPTFLKLDGTNFKPSFYSHLSAYADVSFKNNFKRNFFGSPMKSITVSPLINDLSEMDQIISDSIQKELGKFIVENNVNNLSVCLNVSFISTKLH